MLTAIFGPWLGPIDSTLTSSTERLQGPSATHWLGTDDLGRDLLSRVIVGARISLLVSGVSITLAAIIGSMIGLLAGYFRGPLDALFMRLMDILFAFPAILLALLAVAVLGPALENLIMAIVIVYAPAFARIARGATMSVAAEPFVEASRSLGAGSSRIIFRHVAPNIIAPLVVQYTISLAYAVLIEASLSFLGLGVQPPTPSWGGMLSTGKTFLELSPWPSLVPGLALVVTVLGLNLLGDAVRDVLDPRLRQQRSSR